MKLLEFIFQDFWHWLGSLFILGVVFWGFREIILAFRGVSSEENDNELQEPL
jgi:D-alanyl-lipoteichoic acid acyltransferase DltB (MBOAT superfamily)